jgi:hypothetical protein
MEGSANELRFVEIYTEFQKEIISSDLIEIGVGAIVN